MRTILIEMANTVRLSELPRGAEAVVDRVEALTATDAIARRLADLGFVPGETVRVLTFGPVAAEPVLVRIGDARFALRRAEAARVCLRERG